MFSDALEKWTVVIIICLGGVHPQMMPMGYGYGGPMMMPAPMPMPMPVPVPVGIPIPYPESTSTTTTTEANNGGDDRIPIAIPVPVPQFVQIAIPSFVPQHCMPDKQNGNGKEKRNKNCPPCPPCSCNPCTPSFFSFCSPCHQECRCKNGKENPVPQEPNAPRHMPGPAFPMPIPLPAPPPVVIVPFPPRFKNPQPPRPQDSECDSHSVSDSCSEESKCDSCESDHSRRKKKRRKSKSRNKRKKSNYGIYRRNVGVRTRNRGDSGLVEPVLTYVSRNGDIKMKRRLSKDEASALLGMRDPYNNREPYHKSGGSYNVRLSAGEDSNNRQRVVVMSKPGMRSSPNRRQQVPDGRSQHILGEGRKELVFKTPENKKISNLSVSFQITD